MSKAKLYTELKRVISRIPSVKYVGKFNSQYIQAGKHDHVNYPAVYIQFTNSNFRDLGGNANVQDYDCVATLHIVFESYKIDAIEVYELTESIHAELSHFEPVKSDDDKTHFGKMIWVEDREDSDHDVLQIHQVDYKTKVRDYLSDKRFTRTITLPPQITTNIVDNVT